MVIFITIALLSFNDYQISMKSKNKKYQIKMLKWILQYDYEYLAIKTRAFLIASVVLLITAVK